MRLERPADSWLVLFADGRESLFLEGLALACGYRIKEMREELDCSERYVYEVFVRDVGLPPKLWLRWERMVMARRMLGGGVDAYDVAWRLGFCSPGCLCREFAALHGMSPGRYVERLEYGEGVCNPFASAR